MYVIEQAPILLRGPDPIDDRRGRGLTFLMLMGVVAGGLLLVNTFATKKEPKRQKARSR